MANRTVLEVILEAKDKVSSVFKKIKDETFSVEGAFKSLGQLFTAGIVAKGFKAVLDAGAKQELAFRSLRTAVEVNGGSWEQYGQTMIDTCTKMQRTSKYADEDLAQALSELITISGNVNGAFKNMNVVTGMASAMNMDLGSAARYVGMAMNGNFMMLGRYFAEFRGNAAKTMTIQEAMIKLQAKFGQVAQTEGQTAAASMAQLKNAFSDVLEGVYNLIKAPLTTAVNAWRDTIQTFTKIAGLSGTPAEKMTVELNKLMAEEVKLDKKSQDLKVIVDKGGNAFLGFGKTAAQARTELGANEKAIISNQAAQDNLRTAIKNLGEAERAMANLEVKYTKETSKEEEDAAKKRAEVESKAMEDVNQIKMSEKDFALWQLDQEVKAMQDAKVKQSVIDQYYAWKKYSILQTAADKAQKDSDEATAKYKESIDWRVKADKEYNDWMVSQSLNLANVLGENFGSMAAGMDVTWQDFWNQCIDVAIDAAMKLVEINARTQEGIAMFSQQWWQVVAIETGLAATRMALHAIVGSTQKKATPERVVNTPGETSASPSASGTSSSAYPENRASTVGAGAGVSLTINLGLLDPNISEVTGKKLAKIVAKYIAEGLATR